MVLKEKHNKIYKDESLITKSQWKIILQNKEITSELDFKTILSVYNSPQNRSTATEIAAKLGEENYHIISAGNTSFSKRICTYFNIKPPKNCNGGNRWWTIPYGGTPKGDGKYFYILRPELKEAIEELFSEDKISLANTADTIPEIRIIPMSKSLEFNDKSIEVVQKEFFIEDLKNRDNCLFYLRNGGIKCDKNTLLLFQYDNRIIACAKLVEIIKYDDKYDGIYSEALSIDRSSIQIFDPIKPNEIKVIDYKFKKFSQARQILSINCLNDLLALIYNKKEFQIAEEIPEEDADKLFEGAKKLIIVNAYERNSKARQLCLKKHGYKCCVCKFNFKEIYGEIGAGYIEVHHLKPLNEINEKYQVDPAKDLRPVCPNCHAMLHKANVSINELIILIRNKKIMQENCE